MRAYEDLREYLSVLEQERQLLRITEPVGLEPDLAAAACAATRTRGGQPSNSLQQHRRLHQRPGGDERAWLVA